MLRSLESKAQAEVVVAIRSIVPVAISYAAVSGVVVPAATTVHAVRARYYGRIPNSSVMRFISGVTLAFVAKAYSDVKRL